MLNQEQARAVADQYPGLGAVERAHMIKRLTWCQYDDIAGHLPPQGDILDIGCGYGHFGVYFTSRFPQARLWGCDPDQAKIAVARLAQNQRRRYFAGACTEVPQLPPSFDGIVILDILYLMPPDLQEETLAWAASRLKSPGSLVIKTIDPGQGWRSLLANLQEWVMVKLLRKTYSSGAFAAGQDPSIYTNLLGKMGIACRIIPLPGNRTPSVLITGKK